MPEPKLSIRRIPMDSETLRDYCLLPWWKLRYAFAWAWAYLIWQPAWRLNVRVWPRRIPGFPNYGGRHVDPDPVSCDICWWAGPRRWCVHGYAPVDEEDVEPIDFCPMCDNEI